MKKAAIVILNWNGKKLLEKFLPPLLSYTPAGLADIIIADNHSEDNSVEFLRNAYPGIQLITFEKNHGFAEGYNKALFPLNYEYVVLLNSDVEVTPGWFENAIRILDKNKDITALQPKILAWNDKNSFEYAGACGGYIDRYGYPFCRGRIFNRLEKDNGQYEDCREIAWASGACLFIRLEDYKNTGGLDSRFFAHQEEIDLCWRLISGGKKIVCLPSSVVYHVGGATLKAENPYKTYLNFRNNLLMLYKNLPENYLKTTFFIRFFLDWTAALVFFLKGNFANANAVRKGRRDFHIMKKEYRNIRKLNPEKSLPGLPKQIYPKSIIFAYYFLGKKTYKQLETGK